MRLTTTVTLAHVFLVFLFIYFYSPSPSPPSPKKAQIRTVILEKSSKPIAISPKKTTSSTKTPKPKQTSTNKKKSPTTKSSKPTAASIKRKKLLNLMQESLNTLESNPTDTSSPSLPIGKLASEQLPLEAFFEEELASYLQQVLKLPYRGTVTLQLTLTREGEVKKVTILSATQEENHRYIASTLPTLSLPPFRNRFKGEKEHTFSLTLTSLVEKN